MVDSKFQSVFSKGDSRKIKAPSALKKHLDQNAPKGYSYELFDGSRDMYVLRHKNSRNENNFQIRIKFPLIFEGMNIKSIDELLEAMYRTQKSFKLDEELQNNPPTIIHIGENKIVNQFIGSTEGFPELPPLKIKVGYNEVEVPIKRVPFASLNEIKIVSDGSNLFKVEMIYDEKSGGMKLTVKLNYDFIETLDQYFEHFEYISDFYKKGITILGKVLLPEKSQIKVFEKNNAFLSALARLQEYFTVKFHFPHEVDKDDIYYTKILFESFINNRMVSMDSDNQISFTFEKDKFDLSDSRFGKEQEVGVVLDNELKLELFGANINVLEYKVYPRMSFENIVIEADEIRVLFNLPPEGKYYIKYSDVMNDYKSQEVDKKLFEYTKKAIFIEKVDFS